MEIGDGGRDILLYADGLFELHAFEHLGVGTGSGIGGGSLIYTNVLEAPVGNFSAAFPPDLWLSELRSYFGRVRAMVRSVPLPARALKRTSDSVRKSTADHCPSEGRPRGRSLLRSLTACG